VNAYRLRILKEVLATGWANTVTRKQQYFLLQRYGDNDRFQNLLKED